MYHGKGGKSISSGGYGCVFYPALKCQGRSSGTIDSKGISKLMYSRYAEKELSTIEYFRKRLKGIRHYSDYFLLDNFSVCKPDVLTRSDLQNFGEKCRTFRKKNITSENINTKLSDMSILNMPYGGVALDSYLQDNFTYEKLHDIHVKMLDLLHNGILPMNRRGIYHSDIKDSNILYDEESGKLRLIDWGLSVSYEKSSGEIPDNWRDRPLQYNVPFSVILLTSHVKYEGDESPQIYASNYLNEWMNKRGAGHYNYINDVMYMLMDHELENMSHEEKLRIIEFEYTRNKIVDYISYTLNDYSTKEGFNVIKYINEVYIHNLDIVGFLSIYISVIEVMYMKYNELSNNELKLYESIRNIIFTYMFNYGNHRIDITKLDNDLRELGGIIKRCCKIKSSNLFKEVSKSSIKSAKQSRRLRNVYIMSGTRRSKGTKGSLKRRSTRSKKSK